MKVAEYEDETADRELVQERVRSYFTGIVQENVLVTS